MVLEEFKAMEKEKKKIMKNNMKSKKKIIAIGDLHGHYGELMILYDKILNEWGVDPERDEFVFLGDYVDGGPDTNKVISQLIEWKTKYPHWKFLYGNHEDLMIDAMLPHHPTYGNYSLWWNQGGRETFESYTRVMSLDPYEKSIINIKDVLPKSHLTFIIGLDTFYETKDYFFVHGGLEINKTLKEVKEEMKRYDMIWMRDPFINSKWNWGKKIIFGHTADYDGKYNPNGDKLCPIIRENKIGIDTMAHNTGKLTALLLPEEKFLFQNSLS